MACQNPPGRICNGAELMSSARALFLVLEGGQATIQRFVERGEGVRRDRADEGLEQQPGQVPDLSHSINGARHSRLGIRRELQGDGGHGAAKTAMPTFLRNSRRSFSASSRSSSFSLFIAIATDLVASLGWT